MKKVTRHLGLVVLIPAMVVCGIQGARAADVTAAPTAASPAAITPSVLPNAGEIKVEGTVQSFDTATGKLVLLATAVTLPGKDTINLNPSRRKTITVDDATMLVRKTVDPANSPALKIAELKPDVKVIADGKDLGVGQEMPARLLQADVKPPAPFVVPPGPPPTDEELKRIKDDIFRGSIDDLAALVGQRPSLALGPYPDNDTPVHQAIFWNKPDIVDLFLKSGAALDVKNYSFGRSPLMTAIFWGRPELAQSLIDKGADINSEENDGKTPLSLARDKNLQDIVAVLEARNALEEGPTRGPKAIQWGAPIFEAVTARNADQVKALLDKDPKLVNARNAQGETPLIATAFSGNMDIEDVLLAHGADVNLKNNGGDTAMKKALFFGNTDFVDALKEHGAKE